MDRIEERNGKIRIIDYKTGRVEKTDLTLKSWKGLTDNIKNDKIIQILAYAYMFENEAKGKTSIKPGRIAAGTYKLIITAADGKKSIQQVIIR